MPPIQSRFLAAGVFVALALAGCNSSKPVTAASSPSKTEKTDKSDDKGRKMAPEFELKDSDGRTVRMSDYKGKVVLLDFWATWCGPCKIEIPWFIEFERNYKDKGFAVLGVAMDDEGWTVVKPFMKEMAINYRVVHGNDATADSFGGVEALPTTFLIDRGGKIAAAHVGLTGKDEFEDGIKKLMELRELFKNARRFAVLAVLCLPFCSAQTKVLSIPAPAKLTVKRGAEVELKTPVALASGYHVNSNTPSESYLIPLRLTWEPGSLDTVSVAFPKPHLEKYEFSEKPLSVFTGDFELVTRFKVAAKAPTGPGVVMGKLRYQACNSNSCLPPRVAEIKLPVVIQ